MIRRKRNNILEREGERERERGTKSTKGMNRHKRTIIRYGKDKQNR